MSILKGNYNLKKITKKKTYQRARVRRAFEKEAHKRLGGSMVYVSKKK